MTFIDTSVVVAILTAEDDATYWSQEIARSTRNTISPLVILEATMRLTTLRALEPSAIQDIMGAFLADGRIEVISIEPDDTAFAIDAFARYGKGRGHPAQLNLADCLSYACAKRRGLTLLYKGQDFAKTDMA